VPLYPVACGEPAVHEAPKRGIDRGYTARVVTDGQSLFFFDANVDDSGLLYRGSPDGDGVTQLATEDVVPYDMAVDEEQVYWSIGARDRAVGGAIKAADKAGGAPVTLATIGTPKDFDGCGNGRTCDYGIALDAVDVYVAWGSVVERVHKHPGSAKETLYTGSLRTWSVVVDPGDGGNLYWFACPDPEQTIYGEATCTILTMAKSGGTPTVLATVPNDFYRQNLHALAQDGNSLFWVADKSVWTLRKGGGSPTTIANRSDVADVGAFDLLVDGDYVYWVSDTGGLMRVAKSGGDPTVLVSPPHYDRNFTDLSCGPRTVTADATNVYWAVPHYVLKAGKAQ
jgi:hypothetical protein